MIDSIQWTTGSSSGGAGASTATGYSPVIQGYIEKVYIAYVGSPPAGTTDFTLWDENDPDSELIINLTNGATNQTIYPRRLLETNDGTDLTYDGTRKVYGRYVINGRLAAKIAQANDDDSVTVTVWFER